MRHWTNQTDRTAGQPLLNAPRVVTALMSALVLVHVLRWFLPPQIDDLVVLLLGVVPARYLPGPEGELALPGGLHAAVLTLVTYTFLHGSLMHLAVNSIWLLALGSGVARRLEAGWFLAFYLACGIIGGLAYVASHPGSVVPAVGASGAVSGLMGAALRFIVPAADRTRRGGRLVSLLDRRVLVVAALWFALNFLVGQGAFDALTGGQPVAWEAHIGGFVAGLLLFGLFDRLSGRPPQGPETGATSRFF